MKIINYAMNTLLQKSGIMTNELIDRMQITDYAWKEKESPVKLPSHPEVSYLEKSIATLEGGTQAMVLESLQAARFLLFQTLLRPGDNIVSYNSWALYIQDDASYRNNDISIRLSVDGKLETFTSLIDDRTKVIYLEMVSPEFIDLSEFRKICAVARQRSIPVVVDNTGAGPGYLTSPIRYGADIVLMGTEPWLLENREHAGAVIVEGGQYNWRNERFAHLWPDITAGAIHLRPFSLLSYIRHSPYVRNVELIITPGWKQDIDNIDYILYRQSVNTNVLTKWLEKQPYVRNVFQANTNRPDDLHTPEHFRNTFSFQLAGRRRYKKFIRKVREAEIPEYLFKLYSDEERGVIIIMTGYGDSEDARRMLEELMRILD